MTTCCAAALPCLASVRCQEAARRGGLLGRRSARVAHAGARAPRQGQGPGGGGRAAVGVWPPPPHPTAVRIRVRPQQRGRPRGSVEARLREPGWPALQTPAPRRAPALSARRREIGPCFCRVRLSRFPPWGVGGGGGPPTFPSTVVCQPLSGPQRGQRQEKADACGE